MAVSVAAMLGAAGLGAAANSADTFFNWGINRNLNDQQQEMALIRQREEQAFNALEAQKQRDFESTAYQRTVADMQAAGINPASILGSMNLDSGGAAARSSAAGTAGSNFHGSNIGAGVSNIMSSAINGMIAKDRDAAKYLADEFRDNAKHAHHVEEMRERLETRHQHRLLENDSLENLRNKNKFDFEDYRHNNRLDESVSREEDKTLRRMLLEADKQRYKLELLDKKIKHLTDIERFKRSYGHKSYRD